MDQPKDTAATGNSATPEPQVTPEISRVSPAPTVETPPLKAVNSELPAVESPSISPADLVKATDDLEPAGKSIPELHADAPVVEAAAADSSSSILKMPRLALRPRHKRYALLAASVAVAAALGGVIGALATGSSAPPVNTAALEDTKAMQQSMAKLAKEVTTLKANLEEANKATRAQVAQVAKLETKLDSKIDSKIAKLDERLKKDADEVTGSISAPQTVAPNPTPAPATAAAVPVPLPRPTTRVAAAPPPNAIVPPAVPPSMSTPAPARMAVVPGWSIHDARGGYIYVESRGDIYQVIPGAQLPGLGQVESIKRMDGRWVVTTPRGIIVSMRDKRYFEN